MFDGGAEMKNEGVVYNACFTVEGIDPYETVGWVKRDAVITGVDGEQVFLQKDVEAPSSWSKNAVSIVASKYFKNGEHSVRQLISRVVDTIASSGEEQGYFTNIDSKKGFAGDLAFLLLYQYGSFNSPVWFNVGVNDKPQSSACFILSLEDSMDSIMDLAKKEARIFKWGSGCGTNLSVLRSSKETVRGGGYASGPVSFMRGYDSFAGIIKSGGIVRRAAKMQILDVRHPDIMDFVTCKPVEERKAKDLINAGWDGGLNGEAYSSVAFQNLNLSVRVTDDFMEAVETDGGWKLKSVTTGEDLGEFPARDLMRAMAKATWECGDPGIQYDDSIQRMNPCKSSGYIRCTNPCQPAWAPVLTPSGIITVGEIKVGDDIWGGSSWTTVIRKKRRGGKEVYAYRTRGGVFYGTSDHNIVCRKKKVPVCEADSIDINCGDVAEALDIDPRDVMDGLVIGDGSVHKASNNLVYLDIGGNDGDYFDSEITPLISERYKVGPYSYKVECSISYQELPKTYFRQVPSRFYYGNLSKVAGFLRGLYSANGSVVANRVTLKAASFDMISQVQQMLSALGIRSYYTVNKSHDVEFDNGVYRCKESYDLNICVDRKLFRDLIGFIQKGRQDRLECVCKGEDTTDRAKKTFEIVEVEFLGEEEVYDITVACPRHTYWTGGLLVGNCSEYVFLDDTACNLASLNLMKFYDEEAGKFDKEKFVCAVETFILAMDIIVDMSSYPDPKITKNSHCYRPLGLGYGNLGGLLMSMGLPYDSDKGREVCSVITALMTFAAYKYSSYLAEWMGCYRGQCLDDEENELHHLRVLKEHKAQWEKVEKSDELSGLSLEVDNRYDLLLLRYASHGLRNAQVTLLAPTGTIGFMMDFATTGIEPELNLVKYKDLVGGGRVKLVNPLVGKSLKRLGYGDEVISKVEEYVDENDTISGCGHLKEEHLPVFDCSLSSSADGRVISPEGHLKMLAAAQPFLSGGISKTINVPESATVEDIENIFKEGWKLGLKCVSVYRDNCKAVQPYSLQKNGPKNLGVAARKRLPDDRDSVTRRFVIHDGVAGGNHKGYITVGLYESGKPGEIFIKMAKQGSTVCGLVDGFATVVSIALQYGVPLEIMVSKICDTRFPPYGFTESDDIKIVSSILDYIGRFMKIKFLEEEAIAQEVSGGVSRDGGSGPACPNCGNISIRDGKCFICVNCGTPIGSCTG